jgi:hypothetical protein
LLLLNVKLLLQFAFGHVHRAFGSEALLRCKYQAMTITFKTSSLTLGCSMNSFLLKVITINTTSRVARAYGVKRII